ncbi:MAG: tyrosine-type recombinase/integrase [Planctomycetota bacterium]
MLARLPFSFTKQLARHDADFDQPDRSIVAGAISHLIRDRELDGIQPKSLRGGYIFPAVAVLDALEPGATVASLTYDEVRALVLAQLARGYAPQTVRSKHLPLVRMVLVQEGLEDFTPLIRRRQAALLEGAPIPRPIFEPEELHDLWHRIRTFKSTRALPSRRADLAILRMAGQRMVRLCEFARVQVEDFDEGRRALTIAKPKDRSNPRVLPLSSTLMNDCRSLRGDRTSGALVVGGERRIRRACESWQRRLNEPRLTFQGLRASCATALEAQGAPYSALQAALGHARGSKATLLYTRSIRRRLLEELARLDSSAVRRDSAVREGPELFP